MICCAGKVLLTAMSVISSTLRPERRAAELICSRIREIFSEVDIEDFNHRGHRVSQRNNSKVLPLCFPVSSVVKIFWRATSSPSAVQVHWDRPPPKLAAEPSVRPIQPAQSFPQLDKKD